MNTDTEELESKCESCRHWIALGDNSLGECRRGWPIPNGKERALWPLTMPADVCGYFSRPPGSGSNIKVTDAEIVAMVRATENDANPMKRAWLVNDLVAKGLARTSALERIKRMVARGDLGCGQPGDGGSTIMWLPGKMPAVVVAVAGPMAVGRPGYKASDFLSAVGEHLRKRGGSSKQSIVRVMGVVQPGIGQGTAYRLISAMEETRNIHRNADGLYFWGPCDTSPEPDTDINEIPLDDFKYSVNDPFVSEVIVACKRVGSPYRLEKLKSDLAASGWQAKSDAQLMEIVEDLKLQNVLT